MSKVIINSITGIDDAMTALLFSKRSYTPERDFYLRSLCKHALTRDGFNSSQQDRDKIEFLLEFEKLIKYGLKHKHTTILQFIDISVTMLGIHRAGQDDLDSHAFRMWSRVVRASTRLAEFSGEEKSDWYKGKILSTDEVIATMINRGFDNFSLPDSVTIEGVNYVKAPFGYANKMWLESDEVDEKDILRGNYPLSIPSNFIFKVSFPNAQHIFSLRGWHSGAHPEVKEYIEAFRNELLLKLPCLGQFLDLAYDDVAKEWVKVHDLATISRAKYESLLQTECKYNMVVNKLACDKKMREEG